MVVMLQPWLLETTGCDICYKQKQCPLGRDSGSYANPNTDPEIVLALWSRTANDLCAISFSPV